MSLFKLPAFRLTLAVVVSLALLVFGYKYDAGRQARDRWGLWVGSDQRLYFSDSGLFCWTKVTNSICGRYVLTNDGEIEFDVFQTNFPYRFRVGSERQGQRLTIRPASGPELVFNFQHHAPSKSFNRNLVGTWLYARNTQHNNVLDIRADGQYLFCGWPANNERASMGSRALAELGDWSQSGNKLVLTSKGRKPSEFVFGFKKARLQKLLLTANSRTLEFFRVRHRSTIKVSLGEKAAVVEETPSLAVPNSSPSPSPSPQKH